MAMATQWARDYVKSEHLVVDEPNLKRPLVLLDRFHLIARYTSAVESTLRAMRLSNPNEVIKQQRRRKFAKDLSEAFGGRNAETPRDVAERVSAVVEKVRGTKREPCTIYSDKLAKVHAAQLFHLRNCVLIDDERRKDLELTYTDRYGNTRSKQGTSIVESLWSRLKEWRSGRRSSRDG